MNEWRIMTLEEKKKGCIDFFSGVKFNPRRRTPLHLLMHPENRRVLYFTRRVYVIKAMIDENQGLRAITELTDNRIASVPDFTVEPWEYVVDSRGFLRHEPIKLDPKDVEAYDLIREKCYGLEFILDKTRGAQVFGLSTDMPMQQEVYIEKARQAKLVEQGVSDFIKTYYVHGWAELRGVSIQEAAKEILFKHEELNILLYQIDLLRIKYTRLIKNEKNIENIGKLCIEFDNENYVYASV